MKTFIRFLMVSLLASSLPLLMGCSGSGGIINPISPDNGETDSISIVDNDFQPPEPVHYAEGHIPWGLWQFSYDEATGEIVPIQIRDASAHWDVTAYLQPPNCNDCLGIKVISMTASMLKLDVSLKNPTALTGRDVRGILITDDANFDLANADAYTTLFDNGGAITLNPFMAFAIADAQRKFLPAAINKREYDIAYASWPPNFSNLLYAVDASWPTNCKEPYDINVATAGQLYDYGGSLEMTVEAMDWQNDITKVAVFSDEVLGVTTLLDKTDATHWHKTITNMLYAPAGTYRFRVQANSPNPSDLSLSDYFNVHIEAGVCTSDTNNSTAQAAELPFGEDVESTVCLPDDQSDFYTFTIPPGQSAQGTLDLSAHFTPTSMKFFNSSLELISSMPIVDGKASINLAPYFLLPGVYFVQVYTNNPDIVVAYELENNASAFTPSYGPASSPWPVLRHDQRRTGKAEYDVPDRLAVDWMITDATPGAGPVLGSDGTVYYTVRNPERLRAVTPDGHVNWEYNCETTVPAIDIVVGWDNTIYVPCRTSLKAIKPSGGFKWQFDSDLGNIQWAPLIRNDGYLIVGETGVGIHCIHPNTKKVIWTYPLSSGDQIRGMALGDNGNIFVTFSTTKILCLNPDGSAKYEETSVPIPVRPPVVDTNGVMYYIANDNYLHAVPADGGADAWSYYLEKIPKGATNAPVLSGDGKIYPFGGINLTLHAVDTSNGANAWIGNLIFGMSSSFTLDAKGMLYSTTYGGYITWSDSANGKYKGDYSYLYTYKGLVYGDFVIASGGKSYFVAEDRFVAMHESPLPETPQLLGEIGVANADYSHVYFADLNGDNRDEIIIRNIQNKELRVIDGADGLQLWDPITFAYDDPWPSWGGFGETALADFDNDGLKDIVTTTLGNGDVPHIYVYKGTNGAVLADITGDNIPYNIVLYDVIGGPFYTPDGQVDITGAAGCHLLVWDGKTFGKTIDLDISSGAEDLLYWYDSNGDNHPDPLVYSFNDQYGPIDGSLISANFKYLWSVSNYYWPYTDIGGNVNDDGVPDCFNYTDAWHLNVTDGATGKVQTTYALTPLGYSTYGWQFSASGDLDGDGYDEIISNAQDDSLSPVQTHIIMHDYKENAVKPIWTTSPYETEYRLIGPGGYSPILCDLDCNGYPDILTLQFVYSLPDVAFLGYRIAVYDGRYGSGIMNSGTPDTDFKKLFMAAGDMNGDNNLDFAIAKTDKIAIYTFNTPIPADPAQRPWLHPKKNLRNNRCTGDDD